MRLLGMVMFTSALLAPAIWLMVYARGWKFAVIVLALTAFAIAWMSVGIILMSK